MMRVVIQTHGHRALVAVMGAAAALSTGCGADAEVNLAPVPSTAPAAERDVCGALPRDAVTRALGTTSVRIREGSAGGLDQMRDSDSLACFVYLKGEDRDLRLDVGFTSVSRGDNQQFLAQFRKRYSRGFRSLPDDLGAGVLASPWSSKNPSAQVTMISGANRLQITLAKGPKQRDQAKDVVALARLLKPYFPADQASVP